MARYRNRAEPTILDNCCVGLSTLVRFTALTQGRVRLCDCVLLTSLALMSPSQSFSIFLTSETGRELSARFGLRVSLPAPQ